MELDQNIDALLLIGLPADAVTTIRRRLAYLAGMLPNEQPRQSNRKVWLKSSDLAELLFAASHGERAERPDWLVLGSISDIAKTKGHKSRYPFLGALLSMRRGDDPLHQRHDEAAAICVAAGLHVAGLWGASDPSTFKAVVDATRAVEQLSTKSYDKVLASLPRLTREPEVLQALLGNDPRKDHVFADIEEEVDVSNWLGQRQHSEPRKLLSSTIGKLKFSRKPIIAPNRGTGSHKIHSAQDSDEVSSMTVLRPLSPLPEGKLAFSTPHETDLDESFRIRFDATKASSLDEHEVDSRVRIESTTKSRQRLKSHSTGIHRLAAGAMARDMARRGLHLPCESATFTPEEARLVAKTIHDAFVQSSAQNKSIEGLFYLTLCLLLGRLPSTIKMTYAASNHTKAGFGRTVQGGWAYQQGVELPYLNYPPNVSALLATTPDRYLAIPLPKILTPTLEKLLKRKSGEVDLDLGNRDELARVALKHLSAAVLRPVTLSKVAALLPSFLHQIGADRAQAAWILGERPMDAPPTHYSQLKTTEVLNTYKKAMFEFWPNSEIHEFYVGDNVGSPIILGENAMSVFLKLLTSNSSRIGDLRSLTFAEQHNRIAVQTYIVLALATGHRPVKSPFERLTDFDISTGWVVIDDKAIGKASARLVPLGPIALGHLAKWVGYLTDIVATKRQAMPGIAQRAEQALASSRPLLFLIDRQESIQFTPSAVQEIMRATLPLPSNWTRHATSTALRKTKLNPDVIDACLGHDGLGVGHQSRASALSHQQLRAFADEVENWFAALGLRELSK